MERRLFQQSDDLRASLLLGMSLFLTCSALLFAVFHLVYGESYYIVALEAVFSIGSGIIYTSLKQGKPSTAFKNYYAYSLVSILTLCTIFGPLNTGVYIWACAVPLTLHLLLGLRHATMTSSIVLLIQIINYYLKNDQTLLVSMPLVMNFTLCYCGIWVMSYLYESNRLTIENSLLYLASRDQLTNAHNRLSLNSVFNHFATYSSKDDKLSLLILDIDFFKQINDSHGHTIGDKILIDFTILLSRLVGEDNLFRIGGEEFCVTLFDVDLTQAEEIGELIRKKVADHIFNCGGEHIQLTLSIGICPFSKGDNLTEILKFADVELYKAKRSGRNQVCICQHGEVRAADKLINVES
jgi:diguanylate cyclase (GGDEF)-like protein